MGFWQGRCFNLAEIVEPVLGPPFLSKTYFEAGIYILRSELLYLLSICHPFGVNRSGPHKHNDWLSFELCMDNQPIIIDPGTFCYTGNIEMRTMFRSTAYHNTVVVDGQEQVSIHKNTFALKNVYGEIKVLKWESNNNLDFLEAEHTGYTRLPDPIVHRRYFLLDKRKNEVEISDTFFGEGMHTFEWYFHLDTGLSCSIEHQKARIYKNSIPVAEVIQNFNSELNVKKGWISRTYNQCEKAEIIYCYYEKVIRRYATFTQRFLLLDSLRNP